MGGWWVVMQWWCCAHAGSASTCYLTPNTFHACPAPQPFYIFPTHTPCACLPIHALLGKHHPTTCYKHDALLPRKCLPAYPMPMCMLCHCQFGTPALLRPPLCPYTFLTPCFLSCPALLPHPSDLCLLGSACCPYLPSPLPAILPQMGRKGQTCPACPEAGPAAHAYYHPGSSPALPYWGGGGAMPATCTLGGRACLTSHCLPPCHLPCLSFYMPFALPHCPLLYTPT